MSAQLPADTFMAFRDFLQATRALRRSPAFTFTAVVTPALGIGASTAALPGSGTPRFGVGTQKGVLRPQFFFSAQDFRYLLQSGELVLAGSALALR